MRILNAVLIFANVTLAALALHVGDTNMLIWNMGIACICTLLLLASLDPKGGE